jgi:hypothetical protein
MDTTRHLRIQIEAEAAMRLRPHPEAGLPLDLVEAISVARLLPCGHLEGFEPPEHADGPRQCLEAAQAGALNRLDLFRGSVGY